jgi:queuine tRNA-ribosyltransferase
VARASETTDHGGATRRQRGQAGRLIRVQEQGLTFQSPIDGSSQHYSPESLLADHERIGADVAIALDPPRGKAPCTDTETSELGERWATRALATRRRDTLQLLSAVPMDDVPTRRAAAAERLGCLPLDGYSVPLPRAASTETARAHLVSVLPRLPADRLRHVGRVERLDVLLRCVRLGIDLVESEAPLTRARAGLLDTAEGALDLNALRNPEDRRPADRMCRCYTCASFSRAYLRHLLKTDELLGYTLASLHNLTFWLERVRRAREEILRTA